MHTTQKIQFLQKKKNRKIQFLFSTNYHTLEWKNRCVSLKYNNIYYEDVIEKNEKRSDNSSRSQTFGSVCVISLLNTLLIKKMPSWKGLPLTWIFIGSRDLEYSFSCKWFGGYFVAGRVARLWAVNMLGHVWFISNFIFDIHLAANIKGFWRQFLHLWLLFHRRKM